MRLGIVAEQNDTGKDRSRTSDSSSSTLKPLVVSVLGVRV